MDEDHSQEGSKDPPHEGWDEMVVDVVQVGNIVLLERGWRVVLLLLGEFLLIDCTSDLCIVDVLKFAFLY